MKINTTEYLEFKLLQQVIPIIYLLSEDEHRTIVGLKNIINKTKSYKGEIYVYKSTTGFLNIQQYFEEIDKKCGTIDNDTQEINEAILHVHKQNKSDRRQLFIFTEADQHLEDQQVIRRIKDFAIQADNSDNNLKTIILLSSKLYLPDKLEKYVDVITYPYPSELEIKNEIELWISKYNKVRKKDSQIEIRTDFEIINALKGLIIPQIHQAITSCLCITKQKHGQSCLDPTVLNDLKRETINKTSLLKFKEPVISFDNVGGLGRLKSWLRKMYGGWTNEGKKFGLPVLKGCLLLGLPGCGKSRICEALANEWHLNLIEFDPSRVFSSRVGESEGNMYLALARIDSLAPAILFIDEIEKRFAGMQSSSFSDAGTTARAISIFLVWMENNQSCIFNMSTCNQLSLLPPELISRFDEIFYVGLPDNNERREIIEILVRENNRDSSKLDLDKLASISVNLSGREIKHAVNEAMYSAFYLNRLDPSINADLNTDILEDALKRKISVIKIMEKQLQHLIKWVGYDKEKRDGVRARFANNEVDEIDALFMEVLENSENSSATNPPDQLPQF